MLFLSACAVSSRSVHQSIPAHGMTMAAYPTGRYVWLHSPESTWEEGAWLGHVHRQRGWERHHQVLRSFQHLVTYYHWRWDICVNNWYTWVDCIGVPEVELGLKGIICLVSGLTMAVSLKSIRLLLLPPPPPPTPPPPPPPCDWEVQLPPPWDVCWEAYGKNNKTVIECRILIILFLKVY